MLQYASSVARSPQSGPKAVRLSDIVATRGSSLERVLRHAEWLMQLQELLSASVEPALANRFQVANVRQNRLILLAPSAAWATRLRMQAAHLLETLHQRGFGDLREIEVRVAPLVEQPASGRAEKPLSEAAEEALGLMSRLGSKSER